MAAGTGAAVSATAWAAFAAFAALRFEDLDFFAVGTDAADSVSSSVITGFGSATSGLTAAGAGVGAGLATTGA
jgi:hypothetical protein